MQVGDNIYSLIMCEVRNWMHAKLFKSDLSHYTHKLEYATLLFTLLPQDNAVFHLLFLF